MLNATFPVPPCEEDVNTFAKYAHVLEFSTAEHIRGLEWKQGRIEELEKDLVLLSDELEEAELIYEQNLVELRNGTAYEKMKIDKDAWKNYASDLEEELRKLKSRNWYQRLFNW